MAWEDFERDGREGFTGDLPLDAFAVALRSVAAAYQERFGRKPTAVEVTVALERVLNGNPARYLSDPEGMQRATWIIQRPEAPRAPSRLDPAAFEGVYGERPYPSYQVIRRATDQAVLLLPVLEADERVLRADYRIVDPSLTTADVELLVGRALLIEYLFDEFRAEVDAIRYTDLDSGGVHTAPYPPLS